MFVSNLLLILAAQYFDMKRKAISGARSNNDDNIERKGPSINTLNTIVEKLLQIDESILSVAVVNMQGQTVASKNKYHIRNGFGSNDMRPDCGIWIRSAFAMVEQCSKSYGKIEAFVSYHENVKLVVVPLIQINSLLVLTVFPSASAEYIISKTSTLVTCHNLYGNWENTCEVYRIM